MRVGIKRDAFNSALARENIRQKDFAKIAGVNSNYITNLKNPNLKNAQHSCGPLQRKSIIEAFGGKYCFDDLFYEF